MRERWRNLAWVGEGPFPSATGEGWDGSRAGSEGCALLVPPPAAVTGAGRAAPRPAALSLVTPPLGPGEFPRVLASALAALEAGWGEVVVNDWGLLSRLGGDAGGRITAGRMLLRARRGPGESDPWPGLDAVSRAYFGWGPLLDPPLLDLLREMGAGRLELDPPRHWEPLPPVPGFRLSLHGDHRMVTLAGNCPFLYDPRAGRWGEGGCLPGCRARPAILLAVPPLPRPLVQNGKLVLEEAGLPVGDLPPEVDRLVFSPNLFPLSA